MSLLLPLVGVVQVVAQRVAELEDAGLGLSRLLAGDRASAQVKSSEAIAVSRLDAYTSKTASQTARL